MARDVYVDKIKQKALFGGWIISQTWVTITLCIPTGILQRNYHVITSSATELSYYVRPHLLIVQEFKKITKDGYAWKE